MKIGHVGRAAAAQAGDRVHEAFFHHHGPAHGLEDLQGQVGVLLGGAAAQGQGRHAGAHQGGGIGHGPDHPGLGQGRLQRLQGHPGGDGDDEVSRPGVFLDGFQDRGHDLGLDRQDHHLGLHHLGVVRGGLHPQLSHGRPGAAGPGHSRPGFPGPRAAGQQPPDNGAAHVAGADEPQLHTLQMPFARFCH